MMYIGIKVAYDEEGRPEERYFTIRFWRVEFRFELSLQPALDEQKAFESGAHQEHDPAADAIMGQLAADMFAAGVRAGLDPHIVGLSAQMDMHQPEESPACTCVEEKTFCGTRTILCRRPGCKRTAT